MRIQVISMENRRWNSNEEIRLSSFKEPRSLDEYDVNVIDISSSMVWKWYQNEKEIRQQKDIDSVCNMVLSKVKSKVIVVLPQNIDASIYNYYGKVLKQEPLKDNIPIVLNIVNQFNCFGYRVSSLIYENTTTTLSDVPYKASFSFSEELNREKTVSDISERKTTLEIGNDIYFTSLAVLESDKYLQNYLNFLFPEKKEEMPKWAQGIEILNDSDLKGKICEAKSQINQLNMLIETNEALLRKNERIKSILYTTGQELADVIKEILGELLSVDLAGFVDVMKEDFLINCDTYTLIGEIKGVSRNIKNEFISQLEVNYHKYLTELEERRVVEQVYQILIVNPFREKKLEERPEVNEEQIALAKRNKCLMIETKTLLALYEAVFFGRISRKQVESLFTSGNGGLLKKEDF